MNDDELSGFGKFEFERRFLVRDFPSDLCTSPSLIVQNYFLADDSALPESARDEVSDVIGAGGGYAIRVRCQVSQFADDGVALINGPPLDAYQLLAAWRDQVNFAAITVKGPAAGGTRYESEHELDPGVGIELVLRGSAPVAKLRYSVWLGEDGWVVDVFGSANAPLMIAECERSSPVTDLVIPSFCYTEITDDRRFANDSLALNPYRNWRRAYEQELASTKPSFRQDFGQNR